MPIQACIQYKTAYLASHAASIISADALQLPKLANADEWYTDIPIRNHEGRVALILCMIHSHDIIELPHHEDFTRCTLAYWQYRLAQHMARAL